MVKCSHVELNALFCVRSANRLLANGDWDASLKVNTRKICLTLYHFFFWMDFGNSLLCAGAFCALNLDGFCWQCDPTKVSEFRSDRVQKTAKEQKVILEVLEVEFWREAICSAFSGDAANPRQQQRNSITYGMTVMLTEKSPWEFSTDFEWKNSGAEHLFENAKQHVLPRPERLRALWAALS